VSFGEGAWSLLASWHAVVCERDVRSDKDIVIQLNAVPELNAALYGNPVANADIVLNKDSIANVAVSADHRIRKQVGECPDARPVADVGRFAERLRVNEGSHQLLLP
jgi:hypothetical protein